MEQERSIVRLGSSPDAEFFPLSALKGASVPGIGTMKRCFERKKRSLSARVRHPSAAAASTRQLRCWSTEESLGLGRRRLSRMTLEVFAIAVSVTMR